MSTVFCLFAALFALVCLVSYGIKRHRDGRKGGGSGGGPWQNDRNQPY